MVAMLSDKWDFFSEHFFTFQELREDNAILTETKNILEEQLSTSHKRVETVIELENELVRYRQQVEEMTLVSIMLVIILLCKEIYILATTTCAISAYHH